MKIKNYDYEAVEENMPFKQSMRKSSGERKSSSYDSWDDDFGHRQYHAFVYRFLEKNVGNDYDETYSKFLHSIERRHLSSKESYDEKKLFRYYFENNCYYNHDRYPYFYIDDNHKIAKTIFPKRYSKDIDIITDRHERYRIKYMLSAEYRIRLSNAIGKTAYNNMYYGYMPIEYFMRFRNKIQTLCDTISKEEHRPYYKSLRIEDLFDIYYDYTIRETIKYGTPEYWKYRAEEISERHKERREIKKHMEEIHEYMLYWAEYRKKKHDEEINNAKIVKHGFDPKTSFRNVPLK